VPTDAKQLGALCGTSVCAFVCVFVCVCVSASKEQNTQHTSLHEPP